MNLLAKTLPLMLRNIGIVIGMSVLGVLFLVVAFLLPIEPIENNVARSVSIIEEQASHPSAEDGAESVIDVFTDSLLLLEASNYSDQSVLMRAMMVWHSECYDDDPTNSLIAQGGGAANESSVDVPYGRYWHGALVFLKPLLVLFDIGVIAVLGGALLCLLVLLVVLRLVKLNRPLLALGFLLGFFSVSFVALAQCIQYWPPVFVMLGTCLAVLAVWEKGSASARSLSLIFTVSGAVVNYLDLLTFPLVALAVPLILYFVLENKISPVKAVCRFVLLSFSWLVSYGLMWVLKWVLGSVLTGTNFFTDAIGAAKVRSGVSFDPISFNDVFFTNLARYLNNNEIFLILAFALFSAVLFCIWIYLDADRGVAGRWPEIASFLIPVALASILVPLWYRGFLQHSFWHPFMTNRDCWVFGFALALGSARFIELIVGTRKTTSSLSPQSQQSDSDDTFVTTETVRAIAKEWYKIRSPWEYLRLRVRPESAHARKARLEGLPRFLQERNVSALEITALCDGAISEHASIHSRAQFVVSCIFSIVVASWFQLTNETVSLLANCIILFAYLAVINSLLQIPCRFNKWVSLLKLDIATAEVNGIALP